MNIVCYHMCNRKNKEYICVYLSPPAPFPHTREWQCKDVWRVRKREDGGRGWSREGGRISTKMHYGFIQSPLWTRGCLISSDHREVMQKEFRLSIWGRKEQYLRTCFHVSVGKSSPTERWTPPHFQVTHEQLPLSSALPGSQVQLDRHSIWAWCEVLSGCTCLKWSMPLNCLEYEAGRIWGGAQLSNKAHPLQHWDLLMSFIM